ncbi:MAG TPA: DUF6010 family protein [Ignavibacteria bacterium]|nr:DUF6010 family protein [Ignavibacteria bacterium]
MTAAIIGLFSGIAVILIVALLKGFDKNLVYGLILSGIGFIYVGFTWSDPAALTINSLQAILFLFIAYFGLKWNIYILIAGYFLHGIWDLVYYQVGNTGLIPPRYDLFCSILDFTVGLFLLYMKYRSDAGKKAANI